jgi:hypothetical protein
MWIRALAAAALVAGAAACSDRPAMATLIGPATLRGTVVDLAASPVGGGIVEVVSGDSVLHTAVVSGAGSFSVAGLTPGTYAVRLQPPLSHSMGPAEPAQRSVTVEAGQSTASVAFTVQNALWSETFQALTTASLLSGCSTPTGTIPAGSFFSGAGRDMGCSGTSNISIDMAGGPGGTRAMRYDWAPKVPSTPLSTYCAQETTIALSPRFNPSPTFGPGDSLWIRFSSKESAGFQHGAPSCSATTGLAYKFFLVLVERGASFARFGTYLFPRTSGSPTDATLGIDMSDQVNRASSGTSSGPIGAGTNGVYRTYHIHIFNLGTNSTTFRVYMNGTQIGELVAPILPGSSIGAGWALTLAMGANINNGPEQAQARWFREISLYRSRPSLRPLTP